MFKYKTSKRNKWHLVIIIEQANRKWKTTKSAGILH